LFIIFLFSFFSDFLYIVFVRERRDPKITQKILKHSPASKRKGSPAKYGHEDEFSPERVAGRPASEHNNDWSKKGREIKR